MWGSIAKQWFLIALAVGFTVGYLGWHWVQPIAEFGFLRSAIVFAVLWAMGITLRPETIRRSLARPLPALLAILINLWLVPVIALPTAWFLPESLFGGLFVAALVPCTLASASVWTRKAGGDDSIAMMTTVATNLACLIVVPVGVTLVLAESTEMSGLEQMKKLAGVVLAPLVLAQVMRRVGWAAWADRHKARLSWCSQLGPLLMVVFGAAASAQRLQHSAEAAVTIGGVALVASTAVLLHVTVLWIGVWLARRLGVVPTGQIAVGISGSQKTLMVGLQIAIDCGVSVIPMLAYHLGQLLFDTLIAERWKRAHEVGPDEAKVSVPQGQGDRNPAAE